jgi:hypothetical protein
VSNPSRSWFFVLLSVLWLIHAVPALGQILADPNAPVGNQPKVGGTGSFLGSTLDNAEYRGLIRLTDTGTRTHWSQVFDSDDNHESIKSISAYQAVTETHALLERRAAGEQTLAPSAGSARVGRARIGSGELANPNISA